LHDTTHKVKIKGVPNVYVPRGVVNYFRERLENVAYSTTEFDYKKAIDNKNVIMTNVPLSSTEWHNILIIGYTKEGNYIYIDPNNDKNFYICSEEYLKSNNSYKYSFEININK